MLHDDFRQGVDLRMIARTFDRRVLRTLYEHRLHPGGAGGVQLGERVTGVQNLVSRQIISGGDLAITGRLALRTKPRVEIAAEVYCQVERRVVADRVLEDRDEYQRVADGRGAGPGPV